MVGGEIDQADEYTAFNLRLQFVILEDEDVLGGFNDCESEVLAFIH